MLIIYLLVCVALIVLFTSRVRLHPFIVLLLAALLYGFMAGMPSQEIIVSINEGFGKTLGSIGLIIILGVIIGAFLENTGGAYAIARKVLNLLGKKKVTPAMGIMGYVVSIPVFADSGFLLLSPLKRSLCKTAGISLAGAAIALSLGLTISHTMVPPTPGPIAAAGLLDANLGRVLMVGLPVSLIALIISIAFAHFYVSRTYIDPASVGPGTESQPDLNRAPGATKALLPVLIPIILILTRAVLQMLDMENGSAARLMIFLGEPFIALLVGVFLAFLLPAKLELQMFSTDGWIGKAIASAASVLLITGAGGAFGKMLQNSGIATHLGDIISHWHLGIWLPFLLAAAIKTAQGSSTVALITTASILAPLMGELGFVSELDKALVVIAIGAGSAVVSHANDSFFWVVTQMSGMDVRTGYRTHTLGTLIMGTSSALVVFFIYSIFS